MFQWISRNAGAQFGVGFEGRKIWLGMFAPVRKVSFKSQHMYEEGIMEYFLENSSQPPIWNSQMIRTFENSSKPKNQNAFFKCILNWVLRQKNSNNLWRCRVSLTGLIPENMVKICIRQSNLSTRIISESTFQIKTFINHQEWNGIWFLTEDPVGSSE